MKSEKLLMEIQGKVMSLNNDDLNSLVDIIKFRRNQISQEAKKLFKVGDKVSFVGNKNRGKVEGKINKINKKYIIVDETNGSTGSILQTWRCPPELLERS